MRFQVSRASQGTVSAEAPCPEAIRGPESAAWPGEYTWYVEVGSLEELLGFLERNGGALGLFVPEEGEEHPGIELFDEDEEDDEGA